MVRVFLISLFLSSFLKADTYVVDNGVTMGVKNCKGFGSNYETIQSAVDAADNSDSSNSDTVEICDGTYNEAIITKNNANALTIKAVSGQDSVKIVSTSYGIKTQNSSNVVIEGITIEASDNAIDFQSSAGVFKIKNVKLKSSNGSTIFAKGAGDNYEIDGIEIISSKDEAILIENGNNGLIKNSCIKNSSSDGLSVKSSNSLEATGNCFSNISKKEAKLYSGSNNPNFHNNYWETYSVQGVSDNSRALTCAIPNCTQAISNPTLLAEYRFDECSWDGTNGEVDDNSINSLDGTAFGAITESNATIGGIGRVGYFDGKDDYIEIADNDKLEVTNVSITAWVRPTNDNTCRYILTKGGGYSSSGYQVLLNQDNGVRWETDSNAQDAGAGKIKKNEWNFIVVTFDGVYKKVYINDEEVGSEAYSDAIDSTSYSVLVGKNHWNNNHWNNNHWNNNHKFKGQMDEIKIFDNALTLTQVQDIYNNEKDGKNYDGTDREAISCRTCVKIPMPALTPLEFEGAEISLNTTTTSPYWTHIDFNQSFSTIPIVFILPEATGGNPATVRLKNITSEGFDAVLAEPQGEDGPHLNQNINFLAVNEGVHKIGDTVVQVGSIDTKKVQQASQGSLLKNEWEDIGVVFDTCNVASVAQIQGIENEEGLDIPNSNEIIRSIPSLTTAILSDDNGMSIALERGETNEGDVSQNETIGYMFALPNIQDSVVDSNDNNISFETIKTANKFVGWDDDCQKVNFVNNYSKTPLVAANKNSKNEADGGWFRRCSLNTNEIGLKIDEDKGGNNNGGSEPPQDAERNHIAEVGSIFAFSDSIVIREGENDDKNVSFDTWDISKSIYPNLDSRIIPTKIANQSFRLHISEVNATKYKDEFNGTLCSIVYDVSDKSELSDWVATTWVASDDSKQQEIEFTVNKAIKEARVYTYWQGGSGSGSCSGIFSHENNETNSTDNFAIRPKSFNFSTNVNPLSTEYYAGENFTIDFDVSNVSQYNEAKDSSFEVIASVTNENCRIDGFEIKDFNFTDGVVNNVDANYSNIGDLNITIKEKDDCSDKFASVDCDDKDVLNHWNTDIDISIEAYSDQIYIKPYKLNVTVANMSASTDEDWLYMANVDDMNVSLFAEVKAFNKQGTVLKDFNSTCYDKEVKIDVKASFDTIDLDINYTTAVNDSFGSLDNVEDASSIDKTITIGDASFTDGEANVTYIFNVDRKYTTPISPFKVSDFNASVQDTSISKEVNWSKSSTQKIFYYGRVVADDIVTQKTPAEHFAEFEVYDADSSSYVTDFKQNSLRWYRNKNHTDLKDGNITIVNDISVNNFHINNNGKIDFNISNTIPNTYNMHIETQEWLFYNPYATNFDTTSLNCMEHPCFKYTFKGSPSTLTGIKSGDFNGTSYEIKPRGKYERTGVKVFR